MPTRVTVTQVVCAAHWSWRLRNNEIDETHLCGICHTFTDGCCPTCAQPGDACPILTGVCTHSFHMHCILRWLDQETAHAVDMETVARGGKCPMCRQDWKVAGDDSPIDGEPRVPTEPSL